jgi:hypothetical protein
VICLEYKVIGFFSVYVDLLFQLMQEVAENVLSFDTPFWLRLATRADMCSSLDDKVIHYPSCHWSESTFTLTWSTAIWV